eukprot:scaffold650499_cov25-Prasinocladus_malaysianus.AAC.1
MADRADDEHLACLLEIVAVECPAVRNPLSRLLCCSIEPLLTSACAKLSINVDVCRERQAA